MHRFTASFLLSLALLVGGCGEAPPEEPAGPEPLDAVQVMKKPFDPPADGRLTQELLDRYVSVLDEQRAELERNGTADLLDADPKAMSSNERTARDKRLATAKTRAMMAMGVAKSEFDWVKRRLVRVGILANQKPAPDSLDGQELALVAASEQATGHDL